MIEMQLELVNKALENAGFPPLNKVGDRFYFHDIRELWEDGKDESYNINKFKLLLSENIIDESDVLCFFIGIINSIEYSYDSCPLVKVLEGRERDGTLYLKSSHEIESISWDVYVGFIKNIVQLGGFIDHEAILLEALVDDKPQLEIFKYLMDNYDFRVSYISEAISFLLGMSDGCIDEDVRSNILNALEGKGVDINFVFDEECEFAEYNVFLAVVLSNDPAAFNRYLEMAPSQETLDQFPWDYLICEHEMNENHMQSIKKLNHRGYELPLDEISDYFEEMDFLDYAKEVRKISRGHT